jgi:site-specific DNA-cytosine methylase
VPIPKIPTKVEETNNIEDALGQIIDYEPAENGRVTVDGQPVTDHFVSRSVSGEQLLCKKDRTKAVTILCTKQYIHPWRVHRTLTLRELAIVQTFPLKYLFCGGKVSKRKQIGNAVPVCLAMAIGESIRESYETAGICEPLD